MDSFLYLSMNIAENAKRKQEVEVNNFVNANVPGFKGEKVQEFSVPIYENDLITKVYSLAKSTNYDFSQGSLQRTNDHLNVAVDGKGFFVVMDKDEQIGFSRRGDCSLDQDGNLINGSGNYILNQSDGIINIPLSKSISISPDGAINIVPINSAEGTFVEIDKIKLVNLELKKLNKNKNGIFVLPENQSSYVDDEIKIKSGFIEKSNSSSAMQVLMDLMDYSRKYEMGLKFMKQELNNENGSLDLLDI